MVGRAEDDQTSRGEAVAASVLLTDSPTVQKAAALSRSGRSRRRGARKSRRTDEKGGFRTAREEGAWVCGEHREVEEASLVVSTFSE